MDKTRLMADVQVVVRAEVARIRVDTLHPAVEELVQVVEVVLAPAALGMSSCRSLAVGEALAPAIIGTNSLEHISATGLDLSSQVARSFINVEGGIPAVTTRSATALVLGDLHETLLSTAANRILVASRLLHHDGRDHNRQEIVFVRCTVDESAVLFAGLEDAVGVCELVVEILVYQVVDSNEWWGPPAALDTAIEPFLRAVGTSIVGGLGDSANRPAAAGLDVDHPASAASAPSTSTTRGSRGSGGGRRMVRCRDRSRRRSGIRCGTRGWPGLGLAALVDLAHGLATRVAVGDVQTRVDGGDPSVGGVLKLGSEDSRRGDEGDERGSSLHGGQERVMVVRNEGLNIARGMNGGGFIVDGCLAHVSAEFRSSVG